MKNCKIAVATAMAAAMLFAGNAGAQKSKVTPARAVYDGSVQFPLGPDRTSVTLEGLKTARIAWLAFSKFQDGTAAGDQQVLTLMEGATAKWSVPGSCSYELTLAASPPAITINKNPKICALRKQDTAVFRVFAM